MQNQLSLTANPLSTVDGRVVISSLAVADILEKEHKHILVAIREVLSDDTDGEKDRSTFRPIFFLDTYSRPQPAYEMSRDGFVLLVSRFTGSKALSLMKSYIRKFNEMEAALQNPKPIVYQHPSTILDTLWAVICPRTCWILNIHTLRNLAVWADLNPEAKDAFLNGLGAADAALRTGRKSGPEDWRWFRKRWLEKQGERARIQNSMSPRLGSST